MFPIFKGTHNMSQITHKVISQAFKNLSEHAAGNPETLSSSSLGEACLEYLQAFLKKEASAQILAAAFNEEKIWSMLLSEDQSTQEGGLALLHTLNNPEIWEIFTKGVTYDSAFSHTEHDMTIGLLRAWAENPFLVHSDIEYLHIDGDQQDSSSWMNQLTSIQFIRNLPNVKELKIANLDNVQSLAGLEKVDHLKLLKIRSCPKLRNFEGLGDAPQLESIDIAYCWDLQNLEGMGKTPKLHYLNLNGLKSLDGLQSTAPTLTIIAEHDDLNDISALPIETEVSLKQSALPQKSSPTVQHLHLLGQRGLDSFDFLQSYPNLRSISINRKFHEFSSLHGLLQLPQLELLGLSAVWGSKKHTVKSPEFLRELEHMPELKIKSSNDVTANNEVKDFWGSQRSFLTKESTTMLYQWLQEIELRDHRILRSDRLKEIQNSHHVKKLKLVPARNTWGKSIPDIKIDINLPQIAYLSIELYEGAYTIDLSSFPNLQHLTLTGEAGSGTGSPSRWEGRVTFKGENNVSHLYIDGLPKVGASFIKNLNLDRLSKLTNIFVRNSSKIENLAPKTLSRLFKGYELDMSNKIRRSYSLPFTDKEDSLVASLKKNEQEVGKEFVQFLFDTNNWACQIHIDYGNSDDILDLSYSEEGKLALLRAVFVDIVYSSNGVASQHVADLDVDIRKDGTASVSLYLSHDGNESSKATADFTKSYGKPMMIFICSIDMVFPNISHENILKHLLGFDV